MATGGEPSGLASQAEFERLMSATKGIEDQMKLMKRELCEEREAADERLVKARARKRSYLQEEGK